MMSPGGAKLHLVRSLWYCSFWFVGVKCQREIAVVAPLRALFEAQARQASGFHKWDLTTGIGSLVCA